MTSAKILIIDDSDAIRDTLRLTLEFKGYEVSEAENGRQGLNLVRENDYDLVICDLAMPEIDGLDVIRALRRDPATAALPVIVLSAEESRAKSDALKAGGTACVDKPFSPKNVLDLVAEILKTDWRSFGDRAEPLDA